ncbi:hypothetical protein A2U01_0015922, partial [Trifolium medium]|nr:hypothetical protein [Trifolium medium]
LDFTSIKTYVDTGFSIPRIVHILIPATVIWSRPVREYPDIFLTTGTKPRTIPEFLTPLIGVTYLLLWHRLLQFSASKDLRSY